MGWESIIGIIFLSIAIVLPPQKHMGVKGFMKNWDAYIEKPAKRLPPPKLIRFRYGIRNHPINIITYLSFLVDFANWLICIGMLLCVFIFKDKFYGTAFGIFAIIYFFINLPIGIVRTVCTTKIAKKKKNKLQTEQYVATRSLVEEIVSYRETKQMLKEYEEIEKPFLKDFGRCLKKKKDKQYISEDGLRWLIDKIIPKYKKYLTYNVLSNEPPKKLLTIYLIKTNEIIIQVPIKKD